MRADADHPADAREVLIAAELAWERVRAGDGYPSGVGHTNEEAADRALAALSAAGLTVIPIESLPEWRCPSCGAVSRARMADTPTGETWEEWGLRRNAGDVGSVNGPFSAEAQAVHFAETGCFAVPPTLVRRAVRIGPWLSAEPEQEL